MVGYGPVRVQSFPGVVFPTYRHLRMHSVLSVLVRKVESRHFTCPAAQGEGEM